MSEVNTLQTLNGLFKEVYADKVQDLIPRSTKLLKAVKFSANKKLGGNYNQPVILGEEQGVTYASANSGAYALEKASAMQMQNAQVTPAQLSLRSNIDIESATRASSSGAAAFQSATGLLVSTMVESMSKRLEISCWYGASATGIGTVASTANANATSTVLTFSAGQYAHGVWVGGVNSRLDIYDSNGVQVNTQDALVVVSTDVAAKTVTVSGIAADITAVDAELNVPMVLYYRGAKGQEMSGVDRIVTNTGVLHNIDASVYDLWRGNVHNGGAAAIDFGMIIDAVATAVNRGLEDDVTCFLNPTVWTALSVDQAALRQYDSSYKEGTGTMGNRAIQFFSQNGTISIVPSSCVKEGDAFILPTNRWARIGSTEPTFSVPGRGESYFDLLPDANGFELRSYCAQSIFTHKPAASVKLTNFTY